MMSKGGEEIDEVEISTTWFRDRNTDKLSLLYKGNWIHGTNII